MRRLHADLLLLLTAALWGFAFVAQKSAMAFIGPLTFIAARSVLAVIVLVPLAIWEHKRAKAAPQPWFFALTLIAACVFLVGAILQQLGLQTATVTNASFLTALYAVCTPFAAWAILKKAPPMIVWPAALISFVGVWLLGGGTVGQLSNGDTLVLMCAPLWAVHIVLTGLAARFNRPLLFTSLQFVAVAILATLLAVAFEQPTLINLRAAAWEIAYVGIASTAIAFSLFGIAMRSAHPAEAAVIVSTENVFAALAGAVFLGERPGWLNWSGAALILAAILVVQLHSLRGERTSQS